MMNFVEKSYFDELFNRGGYVLDFSIAEFDEFTFQSIGIRLCKKYNLSKGKSLKEFTNQGDPYKVIKLYKDLLDFYKVHFSGEIESNKKVIEVLCISLYVKSVKKSLIENYQRIKIRF